MIQDSASSSPHIVDDAATFSGLLERVRSAAFVGLDTEFHQERTYTAHLMVVQIAFHDGIVILDPLAIPDLRPLLEALENTVVVGHALQGDLRIFAERYRYVPPKIFDTQIAAAFAGFGYSISLLDLVRSITGKRLRKSQTVSDWSRRPWSPEQLEYLVDDVASLFQLHDELRRRLESASRWEWALAEMEPLGRLATYSADPERLYLRFSGTARMGRRELGILREVALTRDRLARERDVPPKYILPDDVVTSLVALRPTRPEELGQLRRFDAGSRKQFGADFLAAVARGLALPDEVLPHRPARSLSAPREGLVTLLNVLVASVAAANDLPTTLVAPRHALERIAREIPMNIEEFTVTSGLSSWRVALLAETLLPFIRGETALAISSEHDSEPRIVTHPLSTAVKE